MTSVSTQKYKILSREWLKIFAMVFMVLDHAYMTVVNVAGFEWMTQVGRIAFPIFAFQIAQGYTHTSSKNKYIRNMFIFALISEIPYNIMMGGEIIGPFHQNVMFTFLLALIFLKLIDKIRFTNANIFFKAILIGCVCYLSVIVGTLTFVDYLGFGVLTVLIFYIASLMPNKFAAFGFEFLGLFIINCIFLGGKIIIFPNGFGFPKQGFALISLIFILLYNGKKQLTGKADKTFKYFSYLFYPVHILILSLIALYVL